MNGISLLPNVRGSTAHPHGKTLRGARDRDALRAASVVLSLYCRAHRIGAATTPSKKHPNLARPSGIQIVMSGVRRVRKAATPMQPPVPLSPRAGRATDRASTLEATALAFDHLELHGGRRTNG